MLASLSDAILTLFIVLLFYCFIVGLHKFYTVVCILNNMKRRYPDGRLQVLSPMDVSSDFDVAGNCHIKDMIVGPPTVDKPCIEIISGTSAAQLKITHNDPSTYCGLKCEVDGTARIESSISSVKLAGNTRIHGSLVSENGYLPHTGTGNNASKVGYYKHNIIGNSSESLVDVGVPSGSWISVTGVVDDDAVGGNLSLLSNDSSVTTNKVIKEPGSNTQIRIYHGVRVGGQCRVHLTYDSGAS
jgi:hypothetical protein